MKISVPSVACCLCNDTCCFALMTCKVGALVVRQQPPHPRRLTLFIELFHAAKFSSSTVYGQVPYTFPARAVILGSSILLLLTVDPTGTGEHSDPNRGTLHGETGHYSVAVDSPFCFPYLLLVTIYLFLVTFPFPSLSPWGSL